MFYQPYNRWGSQGKSKGCYFHRDTRIVVIKVRVRLSPAFYDGYFLLIFERIVEYREYVLWFRQPFFLLEAS